MDVATAVVVVVVVVSKVVVATTIAVSVSVAVIGMTDVMVRLLLTTGVMIVVLRAVCVTVTKVVGGVCRQEHANSISDEGRERTLENTLAASVGDTCLLRMVAGTVVVTVSVSVL